MKTKLLLVLFAVAGLSIWLMWPSRQSRSISEPPVEPETQGEAPQRASQAVPSGPRGQQGESDLDTTQPNQDTQRESEELASRGGMPPNVSSQDAGVQWSNAMSQMSQQVNRRIEFYGKAVDEQGQPLAGANAEFSCVIFPEQYFGTNISTGADGFFVLNDVMGAALTVLVTKEGYEEIPHTNQNRFMYYSAPGSEGFQPNPHSPVVFHLQKKN